MNKTLLDRAEAWRPETIVLSMILLLPKGLTVRGNATPLRMHALGEWVSNFRVLGSHMEGLLRQITGAQSTARVSEAAGLGWSLRTPVAHNM